MSRPLLPWMALVLSLFALAVALTGTESASIDSRAATRPHGTNAALESEVAELRDELARLSEEVAWLRRAPQSPPDTRQPMRDSAQDAPLEERLGEMEAALERLEERGAEIGPMQVDLLRRLGRKDDGDDNRTPENILRWQEQAVSLGSTEEEQVQALRHLRGALDAQGQDARDHGVVLAMIDLAQRSEDAQIRASTWRYLSGNTDASLLDPLLHSLANDESRQVREEAAETLRDFLPDATVEAALRYAADHDVSEDVREEARRALRPRRDR